MTTSSEVERVAESSSRANVCESSLTHDGELMEGLPDSFRGGILRLVAAGFVLAQHEQPLPAAGSLDRDQH